MKTLCLSLFVCLSMAVAQAHEASTSYLYWHEQHPDSLRLDIAVTDLMVHFSAAVPEQLSWSELQSLSGPLGQHLLAGLQIQQGETACPSTSELVGITHYTGEVFASWQIQWRCPNTLRSTRLSYRLLFAQDALHRAILNREGALSSDMQLLGRTSPPVTLASTAWPLIALAIIVFCGAMVLAIRRWRRSFLDA